MLEDSIQQLLTAIGEDTSREGLINTPKRVAAMYRELTSGYNRDPHAVATLFSSETNQDLITVTSIPFYSLCEHHLAPFFGKVHIGYIPSSHILGLSKFARIVDIYARRLQVQERLTHQIADALEDILKPQALAIVIEAEHLCMSMRGINKPGSITHTETVRGSFKTDPVQLDRFFRTIHP